MAAARFLLASHLVACVKALPLVCSEMYQGVFAAPPPTPGIQMSCISYVYNGQYYWTGGYPLETCELKAVHPNPGVTDVKCCTTPYCNKPKFLSGSWKPTEGLACWTGVGDEAYIRFYEATGPPGGCMSYALNGVRYYEGGRTRESCEQEGELMKSTGWKDLICCSTDMCNAGSAANATMEAKFELPSRPVAVKPLLGHGALFCAGGLLVLSSAVLGVTRLARWRRSAGAAEGPILSNAVEEEPLYI